MRSALEMGKEYADVPTMQERPGEPRRRDSDEIQTAARRARICDN